MDQTSLAALWAAAWPFLTAAIAIASTLDALIPQPAPGSHWLIARKLLSFVAVNVSNASNGAQPSFVTWIVRIATPVLQAQGVVAKPSPDPAPAAGQVVGAFVAILLLSSGLSACATSPAGTVANGWTATAAADVEVNVALGAVTYLKTFEDQVPGAKAAVQAAGHAIATAVTTQANGMVAGSSPLVQTEQAAIIAVIGVAPQLNTLLTTKQTGSGSTITVAGDLAGALIDEVTYVLPAVFNANAGATTAAQLQADEAALQAAAAAL